MNIAERIREQNRHIEELNAEIITLKKQIADLTSTKEANVSTNTNNQSRGEIIATLKQQINTLNR